MPLFNLTDLPAHLPPHTRLLGIDPGARRVGLALSDVLRRFATPLRTVPRGKLRALVAEITPLVRHEALGGLIVGLPLEMDGTFGPAAQAARDWALALAEATSLPTAMQDERLSTHAVTRMLVDEADLSRARRAKVVDAAAAAWLLQSALDRLNQPG